MASEDNQNSTQELEFLESEHLPSLGKEFRDQRESRNIAIEQVSIDLHIDRRFLHAIENDDFTQIGKRVFIRGYVCNYARYLNLNQELVLEMLTPHLDRLDPKSNKPKFLDKDMNSAEHLDYTKAQLNLNSGSPTAKSGPISFWVGLVLLLLILAGGLLGYIFFSDDEMPSQFVEVTPPTEIELNLEENNSGGNASVEVLPTPVILEPEIAAEQSTTTNPQVELTDSNSTNTQLDNSELTIQEEVTDNQEGLTSQALVTEGTDQLLFKITRENWIEVRRTNGSIIISRLFRRNENPLLKVSLPVDVIIGNASSASLTLNGLNVNFDSDINNNVARLRIPQ